MNIGQAIEALERGCRVSKESWGDDSISLTLYDNVLYLNHARWVVQQTDLLAKDYIIVS